MTTIVNVDSEKREQWDYAEAYFKRHPKKSKLNKSKNKDLLSHYFINVSLEGHKKKEIFMVLNRLGEGGFAKVKLCQNREGQLFAVRIEGEVDEKRTSARYKEEYLENEVSFSTADKLVKRRKKANKNAEKNKKTELKILKDNDLLIGTASVKSPKGEVYSPKLKKRDKENLNSIQGANVIKKKKFTVVPLFTGGTLKKELAWIKAHRVLSNEEKVTRQLKLLREAAEQVKFYNEQGIVHADIKAENFMLETEHSNVRLIDFGLAKIIKKNNQVMLRDKDNQPVVEGTDEFIAPEIREQGLYSFNSDLWALAQMLKLEFDYKEPGPLKAMMESILDMDNPDYRPTIDEFIKTIELQTIHMAFSKKAEQQKLMEQMNQFRQEQAHVKPVEVEAPTVQETPKAEQPAECTFDAILSNMKERLQEFKSNQELKLAKHTAMKNQISYFEGLALQRTLDGVERMLSTLATANKSKPSIAIAKLTRDLAELQKIAQNDRSIALLELCKQLNEKIGELKQEGQSLRETLALSIR